MVKSLKWSPSVARFARGRIKDSGGEGNAPAYQGHQFKVFGFDDEPGMYVVWLLGDVRDPDDGMPPPDFRVHESWIEWS